MLLNIFFIVLKQCLQTIPWVVQTNENYLNECYKLLFTDLEFRKVLYWKRGFLSMRTCSLVKFNEVYIWLSYRVVYYYFVYCYLSVNKRWIYLELNLDCIVDVVTIPSPSLQSSLLSDRCAVWWKKSLLCWRMTNFCSRPGRVLQIAGCNWSDNDIQ